MTTKKPLNLTTPVPPSHGYPYQLSVYHQSHHFCHHNQYSHLSCQNLHNQVYWGKKDRTDVRGGTNILFTEFCLVS